VHKTIFEIKARCSNQPAIRQILRARDARCIGTDRQKDTYFRVPSGRLKLREGTIERALIHYLREDRAGPKRSDVLMQAIEPGSPLGEILSRALGVLAVVEKEREIYYIGNVKFHLDRVDGLGEFIEIEAIGEQSGTELAELESQCRAFCELFGISEADLVVHSYADMVMAMDSSGPGEA
jgi:adenylate cyclase, class 2